ncbi:MAG: LPS export ABC transporter periplasmic protein LptC [Rhodospirillaceae bacterium]
MTQAKETSISKETAKPSIANGPQGSAVGLAPVSFQPRTAEIRASVAKYSRFVSTMKILLPSVAGMLLALVLFLPQLREKTNEFTQDIVLTGEVGSGSLSLLNARYFGTDDSGQQFSVTAESVKEASGSGDYIDLLTPRADISLNNGTWLVVGADEGYYNRDSQVLNLKGKVNLFQDQGYELHTEAATILLDKGRASSITVVRGQGPFGELVSKGFELTDKGKNVYFTGPARLLLNMGNVATDTP